jgi:hypothetical protein
MFDYLLVLALFPRQENTQVIPLSNEKGIFMKSHLKTTGS